MLVSSPSPSAALRPSPSPSTAAPQPPLSPCSTQFSRRLSSTSAAFAYHNQHYESAADRSVVPSSPFTPRSSRVAIEELRSALKKHSVSTSPTGPSGDLARGRMSAGQTSLEGGISAPVSAAAASIAAPGPNAALAELSDRPANNGPTPPFAAPPTVPSAPVAAPAPTQSSLAPPMPAPTTTSGSNKRNSPNDPPARGATGEGPGRLELEGSQSKRLRGEKPATKCLPLNYEFCDPKDLVVLISSMLMELIRFNDKIPLHQGRLTRFHSRSPPRISVQDYLQRLTTHATLSPPILLSMVYYIDRLCALYPAFTVSSLTIHRFLITSATVASKGLSDSFWTNKTYARVGGISLTELALLELEFLFRVEWRIVPQPEVLNDYYQSLAERCDGYEIGSS
ncbi:cyclin-domain-containing protein [Aspergillus pseudoustus]|uniref:Cyclin-domain-containing protein n=1 Tax=Aspergillus pseudoustus TaxID=1810923 RepID=A0ABR4JZA8_9EURO